MRTAIRMSTRYKSLALFVAVFLLLLVPSVLRWEFFHMPGIIGYPTYLHQRTAEDIIAGRFEWYDPLSFGGRPYTYPPAFPFMLAFFGLFFGLEWGGVIMMALLGAAGAALFYNFFREFVPGREALVIFAASPLFIFLFLHLSTRSPPIILGMLAVYAFIKKKNWLIPSLSTGAAFLFSPETGLISFAILALYSFCHRDRKTELLKTVILSAVIASAWYAPFLMHYGLPAYNLLHEDYALRGYEMGHFMVGNFFWETGYEGFPFIVIALSVIGLWKCSNRFLRLWMVFALVSSFLLWRLFFYSLFIIPVMAACGLGFLRKGTGRYGKFLEVVVLVYVLMAGTLFALEFASGYPIPKQTRAIEWIRDNTPAGATILSDWTYGHWISGIAYRKNFMDGYAEYAPDADRRMEAMRLFYHNCTVPEGYNITYIYMEDWIIRREGMECIFSGFEAVYNESEIYVFKV